MIMTRVGDVNEIALYIKYTPARPKTDWLITRLHVLRVQWDIELFESKYLRPITDTNNPPKPNQKTSTDVSTFLLVL